jgi:hypothetical protein
MIQISRKLRYLIPNGLNLKKLEIQNLVCRLFAPDSANINILFTNVIYRFLWNQYSLGTKIICMENPGWPRVAFVVFACGTTSRAKTICEIW